MYVGCKFGACSLIYWMCVGSTLDVYYVYVECIFGIYWDVHGLYMLCIFGFVVSRVGK